MIELLKLKQYLQEKVGNELFEELREELIQRSLECAIGKVYSSDFVTRKIYEYTLASIMETLSYIRYGFPSKTGLNPTALYDEAKKFEIQLDNELK